MAPADTTDRITFWQDHVTTWEASDLTQKADGFDENLPRIQVHLELDAEEKAGATKTFYTKVKEELDIVPAQARVIEYWQEKTVFDTEDGGQQVKAAARPVHPLGKCLGSTDLLAWVLTSKYADARSGTR